MMGDERRLGEAVDVVGDGVDGGGTKEELSVNEDAAVALRPGVWSCG